MLLPLLLAAALQPVAPDGKAPSTQPPPPVAINANNDPVICRHMGQLGSRLGGERVCLSKSQWAAREAYDKQQVRDAQQRGFQNTPK